MFDGKKLKEIKGYIINSEMVGGCSCQDEKKEEMKGGSWGQSQWHGFVAYHMKENDLTWACALADIKRNKLYENYKKSIKQGQKEKKDKKEKTQEPEKEKEESFDTVSGKLQQLLYKTNQTKIIKVLNDMNFKGKIQTNPMLRTMQILQNFNTIEKMKKLINELEEPEKKGGLIMTGGGLYHDFVKKTMKTSNMTWAEAQCKIQTDKSYVPIKKVAVKKTAVKKNSS